MTWNRNLCIAALIQLPVLLSCTGGGELSLAVIAPGHFHSALVQKNNLPGLSREIDVYAPEGDELRQYLASVERFTERPENPAVWNMRLHTGDDFLSLLPEASSRSAVVLAGNNSHKTDYILHAVRLGYNVLTDKPMAIDAAGFEKLREAYREAENKGLVIYDMMTERYDALNIVTRRLLSDSLLFGTFRGSPSVEMTSGHYFYKNVSGAPLRRPDWYYDVRQQGEGIADVTTHLIDLVFWQCFPDIPVSVDDVTVDSAEHSPVALTKAQYSLSTGLDYYPEYLGPYISGDVLQVMANGRISFTVRGVPVEMNVRWDFEPEDSGSDTFYAVYRGTRAEIHVCQDNSTGYKKELYVNKLSDDGLSHLESAVKSLSGEFPGIAIEEKPGGQFFVRIPDEARPGHEEHFNILASDFVDFALGRAEIPVWERPNTLSKYYITTTAVKLAAEK